MRALQRLLGVPRIGWVFVAPNLLILGLFTFLPIVINFYYAFTGGAQLYPASAAVRRAGEPRDAVRLRQLSRSVDVPQGSVLARGRTTPAWFALLQVGADGAVQPHHRAGAQPQDPRARLLPRRVLLPGAALAGRRRADLEMGAAARRRAQRDAASAPAASRRPSGSTSASWAFFWSVFVSIWAHMGFYTLILLAGPAGDSGRPLRGGGNGPRVAVAALLRASRCRC